MTRSDITKVIPGFTDLKQQPGILRDLKNYAKSMGFADDEFSEVRDRRRILMVYKAMMYDKILDTIPGKQIGEN